MTELFTGAVEIDHILPYSLTLNDSYMNKVVCFAKENQEKGQRTPREAFESNTDKWEQIEGAISRWYQKHLAGKRNAFYKTSDDLDKDFIGNQLNDTRYISREALHYLKTLGADISTVKGQVTSWLRHVWGMNSILDDAKTEKDRSDHRHHAIDAAVIACIDRSLYSTIVTLAKKLEIQPGSLNIKDIHLDPRYDNFRKQVKQILHEIIIAHAPERKITGALHEDTGSGFVKGIGTVYRKAINTDTKPAEIKKIIDPEVRKLVVAHLERFGGSPKLAFTTDNPVLHKDGKTPLKRVRILQSKTTLEELEKNKLGIRDSKGNVFKWMTLGNTHHVEIFRRRGSSKYHSIFVSALEATQRAHQKKPIVNHLLDENHIFIMALHKNDMVSINNQDEIRSYRVQKLDGKGNRVMLRWHNASTLDNKEQAIFKSIGTLITEYEMKPIYVNAIGKQLDDKEND